METNQILLASAAAAAVLVAYNIYKNMGLEYVRSTIDNQLYRVQSKSDKQAAADTLAIIKRKLQKIRDTNAMLKDVKIEMSKEEYA